MYLQLFFVALNNFFVYFEWEDEDDVSIRSPIVTVLSETVEQLSKELKESIWKTLLYEEKDEYEDEDEDEQLSSNHGANMGGGVRRRKRKVGTDRYDIDRDNRHVGKIR